MTCGSNHTASASSGNPNVSTKPANAVGASFSTPCRSVIRNELLVTCIT